MFFLPVNKPHVTRSKQLSFCSLKFFREVEKSAVALEKNFQAGKLNQEENLFFFQFC